MNTKYNDIRDRVGMPMRVTAGVMAVMMFLTSVPPVAWANAFQPIEKYPDPVLTPTNVKVNRMSPQELKAMKEKAKNRKSRVISQEPSDLEIKTHGVFEEALIPQGGSPAENSALARVIRAYEREGRKNLGMFDEYLNAHPGSRWEASLRLNLGIAYRRQGYFHRALENWKIAWVKLNQVKDVSLKQLGDRAAGEIVEFYAWIGEYDMLTKWFKDLEGRDLLGIGAQKVASAKSGYHGMTVKPGDTFKCGPFALGRIQSMGRKDAWIAPEIVKAQSTRKGFTLDGVWKLSKSVGMKYQMAKREKGSEMVLPAVVHWKLNHYGAVIREENDKYLIEDSTFDSMYGKQLWVDKAAFDEEVSGYFLIPDGKLPQGWRFVSSKEALQIHGKGYTAGGDPTRTGTEEGSTCPLTTNANSVKAPQTGGTMPMAQCNIQKMLCSLGIFDTPVGYRTSVGHHMYFTVVYSERDASQPATPNYGNMGPQWFLNWVSYVDDFGNTSGDVYMAKPGGGSEQFTGFTPVPGSPEIQISTPQQNVLGVMERRVDANPGSIATYFYYRQDGTVFRYGTTGSGTRQMLSVIDYPDGGTDWLHYDNNRLISIEDETGLFTTLSYENSTFPDRITKVTDPFGRFATFSYDSMGRLESITDIIGITSSFIYEGSTGVITRLDTPYGSTYISRSENNGMRSVTLTDPAGRKERVDSYLSGLAPAIADDPYPGDPAGMITTGSHLNEDANTFYWDQKAMAEGMGGDNSKAHAYHWMTVQGNLVSGSVYYEKPPLEKRIWHNYPGQSGGALGTVGVENMVGRHLPDGTDEIVTTERNSYGKVTKIVDAQGRTTEMAYVADGINLLEARQRNGATTQLLSKVGYNISNPIDDSNRYQLFLPSSITDASGKVTSLTYETVGFQLLKTITNPLSEVITFEHQTDTQLPHAGALMSIQGPVAGAQTSFTYDTFERVRTVTDSKGYTVTYDYDAADRVTKITYPDGTYEQIAYENQRLEPYLTRDRQGRWTHITYSRVHQLSSITDPLGRITQFDWCDCGSLENLIDPLGQKTTWMRDLEGRVTTKVFADGKTYNYLYDDVGRLKEFTDSKNQKTQYTYFNDGNLKKVDYVNAQIATPSVSFTYDTIFNRIATMTDGVGTTSYSYIPITDPPVALGEGRLSTINGAFASDTIAYTYDELGRVKTRKINGTAQVSYVFDALSRVTSSTNPLGTFGYSYLDQTAQLTQMLYPNGMTANFAYDTNVNDRHLKQIWNKKSTGSTISKFDYQYNTVGQITKWTQQADSATPTELSFGYDEADQLINAIYKNTGTGNIVKQFFYAYDKAGNRTSEQIDSTVVASTHNNVNQLTTQSGGGKLLFQGTTTEPSDVTVNGQKAKMDSALTRFQAEVDVTPGNNTVSVQAKDYSGNNNTTTKNYQVTVSGGVAHTLTYDNNGNTVSDNSSLGNKTYEWDAKDQLVAINSGTKRSEFSYDGMGRRVKIVEKDNGSTVSTKYFVWDGLSIAEERSGTNGATVDKRFFPQGEHFLTGTTTGKFFYMKDHLGNIRELVNYTESTKARYDYDPYGRRTKVSGSLDASFGYTGHYYHDVSGLHLAPYRAYDANLGRWLSRDRIAERGGTNLYRYAGGNPINRVDPKGESWLAIAIVGAGLTIGAIWAITKAAKEYQANANKNDLNNVKNGLDLQKQAMKVAFEHHPFPQSALATMSAAEVSVVSEKADEKIVEKAHGLTTWCLFGDDKDKKDGKKPDKNGDELQTLNDEPEEQSFLEYLFGK